MSCQVPRMYFPYTFHLPPMDLLVQQGEDRIGVLLAATGAIKLPGRSGMLLPCYPGLAPDSCGGERQYGVGRRVWGVEYLGVSLCPSCEVQAFDHEFVEGTGVELECPWAF